MITQSHAKLIDPATLLAGCGSDPVLLQKMIQSFQLLAPERLVAVRDAAQRQDCNELRHAAHNLRGLVSTFSGLIGMNVGILEHLDVDQQPDFACSQCAKVANQINALSVVLSGVSIEDLQWLSALRPTTPRLIRPDPVASDIGCVTTILPTWQEPL